MQVSLIILIISVIAAVIFGNEALGVHPETLEVVDGLVSLPMHGEKASINVGNAAAAILYAIESKE